MVTDLSLAASTDDVKNTIDYGKVAQRLADVAGGSSYFLLEALAQEMLDMIFAEFNPHKVTLTVNKPDILKEAVNVAICMTRERN
jgi:dihydroneopterin aldolase